MNFQISIVDRGEAIRYKCDDKIYVFDVSFGSQPYKLYADRYSREDLGFIEAKVGVEEKKIVERIKKWIESNEKCKITVITEEEEDTTPLRSVDQILEEKLRQRDLNP